MRSSHMQMKRSPLDSLLRWPIGNHMSAEKVRTAFLERFPFGTGALAHELWANLGHLHVGPLAGGGLAAVLYARWFMDTD